MACGVHLGVLLLCLVQAEHVCCLWAKQAQEQNGNTYVGFSQQDNGPRLVSNYPQNQFRQASAAPGSAQSRSPTVQTGYNQGLNTRAVSKPAQAGYAAVQLVQGGSLSKPNRPMTNSNRLNAQKAPIKKKLSLSSSVASSGSVGKFIPKRNEPEVGKRSRPLQQGTQRTSQYLPSRSASAPSPSRESVSFTSASQFAAQQPPSAVRKPASYGPSAAIRNQMSASSGVFSPRPSHLFSPGASVPQQNNVQMQTSASAPARRVSSKPGSAGKERSRFSAQNERTRFNSNPAEGRNPNQGRRFHVTGGKVQGGYEPSSPSRGDGQSLPASTYRQNGVEHSSGRVGPSGKRYAPTKVYNIPPHLGGYGIRRLKEPDQTEASTPKPQQIYTAAPPQQQVSHKPAQTGSPSKWMRVRPNSIKRPTAGPASILSLK